LGANITVDRAESTKPAAPTPTAVISWLSRSSLTTSSMLRSIASVSVAGDTRRAVCRIVPRSSTTPPAILVPPTSIPTVEPISRPPSPRR
jgi:hypothetical protein